ncbi:MAG TPA: MogA/MoaB family molybdenum cofactor biosynthesis protein [Acidobacteriota bacterium]|nr:MogA/MoaB family molybdenum cofactor biosynthesis protein [bacterium]HNX18799.1 MogA/MoaB family molybdenum cofactor biosynthesis protein [Acidobacteriota bacterium]
MKAAVLTLSDSCVAGTRVDESGPHIASRLAEAGWEIVAAEIARDERAEIEAALVRFADELGADVVLTTGGTGFSTRDVTPEATLAVADRRAPGLAEALRADGMRKTPHACLSRGEAALRGATLIVNLPGSLKAAREGIDFLLPLLPHAVKMIAGGGH